MRCLIQNPNQFLLEGQLFFFPVNLQILDVSLDVNRTLVPFTEGSLLGNGKLPDGDIVISECGFNHIFKIGEFKMLIVELNQNVIEFSCAFNFERDYVVFDSIIVIHFFISKIKPNDTLSNFFADWLFNQLGDLTIDQLILNRRIKLLIDAKFMKFIPDRKLQLH